jgi:hypothetical protein
MKMMAFVFGLIFLFLGSAQAQTMLEYSALTGATAAAAAKAKKGIARGQGQEESQAPSGESPGFVEGAMTKLYGDTNQMMSSKSASLLGQAGTPFQMPVAAEPEVKNTPTANLPQEQTPSLSTSAEPGSSVTLLLNSGQAVKGKLVEQTKDYVKLDIEGVTMTYFKEEISRIEWSPPGQKPGV